MLQEALGVSGLLAQVLCARGMDKPADARAFLDPPPLTRGQAAAMPGVSEAVRIIRRAKRLRKTIAVYGDYDADGVIATAILRRALGRFGCKSKTSGDGLVEYYIPHRSEEGYGLNFEAIAHLADKGVELLITADCGITSHPEIASARERGMEVIVTDHHLLPDELPLADAIVHPGLNVRDRTLAWPVPCGALVAAGLAQGLLGELAPDDLDLAAVATIADVVPLTGPNRQLVYHALQTIPNTPNEGLRALLEVAGLSGRPLVARDLAFGIAPRLNAMGRVGDAALVVKALNTPLPVEAMHWAMMMDKANVVRRSHEEEVMAKALAQLGLAGGERPSLPHALVVDGNNWYVGVLGIVASRLARRFGRPAAVISVDAAAGRSEGFGSARSASGLDLYEALSACSAILDRFGGHRQAAGFRLPAEHIGSFRAAFNESVGLLGATREPLRCDALVTLREVTEPVIADLARLEPIGQGNPEVRLCAADVEVIAARRMGQDRSHLRLKVRQGGVARDAIAFGMADELAALCQPMQSIDLAFTPEINEYMGQRSVQLRVVAARPAEAALQVAATVAHDGTTGGEAP